MAFIKARPTLYRGVLMRSRLEATFAQALDNIEVSWTYEPLAFAGMGGQYLPDFELTSECGALGYYNTSVRCFVEVKPLREYAKQCRSRMEIIWESIPRSYLVAAFRVEEGRERGFHYFWSAELGMPWYASDTRAAA